MRIRPLAAADEAALIRLMWAALPPHPRSGSDEKIRAMIRHGLAHDPDGFFVAEDEAGLAGVALAVVREGIWVLAWLGVHPGGQSRGTGGRLLEAALGYGRDCRGFLIASSDDPRAMRLYSRAGFAAQPALMARGRSRLGFPAGVREGGPDDVGHCVEVDRRVRGGGRAVDVEWWLGQGDRLFLTPSGYAVGRAGRPMTVAAEREDEAAGLLQAVLAGEEEAEVNWLTAGQEWAIRTVLEAGLELDRGYAYFTRGELGPRAFWLPNNSLL